MKQIIPSNFRQILMSKIRQIISLPIWEKALSKFRELVPSKYRKWLLIGLALALALLLVCCLPKDAVGEDPVICTIYEDNVNIHKTHDADSSVLDQLPSGAEIHIVEKKSANGSEWGRMEKTTLPDGTKVKGGWINMKYTEKPIVPTEPTPTDPTEPEYMDVEATMGTVITGKLNIRKGAGSKYEAFDSYYEGDRIEILEILEVDDTLWGRTYKGWVGMGYVRMDGTAPEKPDETITSNGNYRILGYGVVDLGKLNVRSGPGTDREKIGEVTEGNRYAYYEVQQDWVRIECGWVSAEFFYMEGTLSDDNVNGIVTTDDLNVRTGPATSFKSVATMKTGDAAEILAQVDGWGYTGQGWINMQHIQAIYSTGTGTITTGLNIRKEPDAGSEKVGSYSEGDPVTILEVNGQWGRTDLGWINLEYVKYD